MSEKCFRFLKIETSSPKSRLTLYEGCHLSGTYSSNRGTSVEALDDFIAEHQDTVFRMIGSMVRDPQRVEDLAQEVFLRVCRGLPHFRGRSQIQTWLYRIIYNVVVDDYRKGQLQPTVEPLDEERMVRAVADPAPFPWQVVERRELGEQVRQGLEELTPRYRMVLTLFYLEEKRYSEIARIMNMPVGTVKTCMHRGRRELRRILLR